jgi:hypothetical protein
VLFQILKMESFFFSFGSSKKENGVALSVVWYKIIIFTWGVSKHNTCVRLFFLEWNGSAFVGNIPF